MDSIGIDLHKRESQLCILTEDGELIERRVVTSRERFTAVLGTRAPAKLLALPLPAHVLDELAPLVALDAELAAADARLLVLAKDHPVVIRLRMMPGIRSAATPR